MKRVSDRAGLEGRGTLRGNLGWSLLLTAANYLFPLVVYMHVSRALGVGGIGLVGFVDSVTTYFILFSMMGIGSLGVRTVARARGNPAELSSAFWNLLALQGLFTLAILVLMALATVFVPELSAHPRLMGVGMCKLVFNVFLVEWLFVGLERFRYVTLRTLLIKTLYVAAVFIFVRSEGDILIYYVLTMLVVVAVAAVNMGMAVRLLPVKGVRLAPGRYVKAFFSLGTFEVITTTYVTFCMVFLGFVSNAQQVGYFSTASKAVVLVSALFVAYAQVMSPRASRLYAAGEKARFALYARRSIGLMLAAGSVLGLLVYLAAPWAVAFLSGRGFGGAVEPLRLMAPLMLVTGLAKVLTMQVLIPSGRDRAIALSSAMGFLACVLVSAWLAPRSGASGAALAWLSGETVALVLQIFSFPGKGSLVRVRKSRRNREQA